MIIGISGDIAWHPLHTEMILCLYFNYWQKFQNIWLVVPVNAYSSFFVGNRVLTGISRENI